MKLQVRHDRSSARIKAACALGSVVGLLALPAGPVLADVKDGSFPTAEQVGGQVFVDPVAAGKKLPTDFDMYDLRGKKTDLTDVIKGKRSLVVFFISAAPVSVNELPKIEAFTGKYGRDVNLVLVNADTVGTALFGGAKTAIPSSVKTMNYVKQEAGLKTNNIYVAPNDVLSEHGVSARLGFRSLPTSFLVDENGMVKKVFIGPQNWKMGDI